MENTVTTNVVLDKKLDGYSVNLDNFRSPNELMVTITLNEYRKLVSKIAISDSRIENANNQLREVNSSLRKRIHALENIINASAENSSDKED